MGNRLYNRTVNVVFGQLGQEAVTSPLSTEAHTRVKFVVEKYSASYANTILLQIFNLNAHSLAALQKPESFVTLNAGYDGNTSLLATGKIFSARPVRQGPDIVMMVEALDTGFDVTKTAISVTVGPGGTNAQVLAQAVQLIKNQGIPLGPQTPLPVKPYLRGFQYGGSVRNLLNDLCAEVGFGWQILDGTFVLYSLTPPAGPTPTPGPQDLPAIVLNVNTGLIEIPSQETPIFEGSRPMYVAKSLLNAELNPLRKVQVQSKFLQGFYEIYMVRHQGDSEEGEFVSNLEVW